MKSGTRLKAYPYSQSRRLAPMLRKEARPMLKADQGLAKKGIERILELSADAHIQRRGTVKGSPEFHHLTGAIAAYGKALALLTELQELEEVRAMISQVDLSRCFATC
jgi:hypothetical protein